MIRDAKSRDSMIDEAIAWEASGNPQESLRVWKKIRAERDTPFAALRYGYVAKELRLLEEALKAALDGLALDPTNSEGRNQWLYCLAGSTELSRNDLDGRKEHVEQALSYFTQALKLDERADFYVFLGAVYMRLDHDPSAETCLRKALALDTSHDEAMYNLAEVIRCSRDEPAPAEAVELYRKAIAIDPHYAQAHRGLAYIFFASEQFEEAERSARRALKFDRSDWGTHTIMGRLLLRKGQIRSARKELERGAELGPFAWEAQSYLASFYDDHGSLTAAQQAFRRCLSLDPENAWANRRYGAVLADMEKPVEARSFLERAVALNPEDRFAPEYLKKLGDMYPHRRVPKRRDSRNIRKRRP
jgi:Tfp pilus assembly protein PilF